MEEPLWTERHAPGLGDLPQHEVRSRLESAASEPMNLFVHGPKGAGKTAAVRALARRVHDAPDADFVEINVADLFDATKAEIAEDPRFRSFVDPGRRRNSSKAALLTHVLKESARHAPVAGSYRTILLDNAEAMREDFQQALRRVMEQYYEATKFVVATRHPSALIAPIRSRCFPVVVRAPTHAETVGVLREILERETVTHDEEGLEYVAGYAGGDLRRAILGAQTTVEAQGELTMDAAYEALEEVESDERVEAMVAAATDGAFTEARSTLDDLLVDEGHSGEDVLQDVLRVVRSRYSGRRVARIHRLAGEVDASLAEGTSDRIQVGRLLAALESVDARVEPGSRDRRQRPRPADTGRFEILLGDSPGREG